MAGTTLRGREGALWLGRAVLVMAVCFCPVTAVAQDGAPAASTDLVFRLDYTAEGLSCEVSLDTEGREAAFKADLFGGHQVTRGVLPIGPGPGEFLGFVFDHAAGRLYIDSNGNLDLTDDKPVSAGGRQPGEDSGESVFRKVPVEVLHGNTRFTYLTEWQAHEFGWVHVTVCSGWVGAVVLDGAEYWMGVSDNLDGRIDRSDSFYIRQSTDGEAQSERAPHDLSDTLATEQLLPCPQVLVVGSACYTASYAFEAGDSASSLLVTLREPTIAQGEIRIEGQFVQYVVLGGRSVVDLCCPGPSLRLPCGDYTVDKVVLAGGGTSEPARQRRFPGSLAVCSAISVTQDKPANVKVGGPLSSTVQLSDSGRNLYLEYELRGIGNEVYGADVGKSVPRCAILKQGKRIFSGTFEYG